MATHNKTNDDAAAGSATSSSASPPDPPEVMQLFKMATSKNEKYFIDQMGTAFVQYDSDIGSTSSPVDSIEFKDYLRRLWRSSKDGIINSEKLKLVIAELSAEARAGESYLLTPRFAHSKDTDSIIYDFIDGTGDVAVINIDGVNVVHRSILLDNTPLLRTESHQKPQDRPERSSDPGLIKGLFKDFMNIPDHSEALLCGWIGVSFLPHLTQPAIYLTGEPASGKTTQLRVLRRLIDPSILELLDPPRRLQDAELQAAQHPVLMYDNLDDTIPKSLSDFWCRVITGGASAKRAHNENTAMVMMQFKAPMAFNGINLAVAKADLLDRTILLHALHIKREDAVEEEAEFYPAFDSQKPIFLGAIFNGLSKAMKIYPELKIKGSGRFGDFVKWGAAFCEATGYGADRFIREYDSNRDRQIRAAIESEVVAKIIFDWLTKRPNDFIFTGTTTALFNTLNDYILNERSDLPKDRNDMYMNKDYPRSPQALTKKLNYLTTMLEGAGIFIKKRSLSIGTEWQIHWISQENKIENQAPQAPLAPLNSEIGGSSGSSGGENPKLL